MKAHVFVISMVLFVAVPVVWGDLIWNSGHREYSTGDETYVYMYNDASVDITGGSIHELYMYDDTSAEVTGGEVDLVWGQGSSNIQVYDGSVIGLLRPNDNTTATVYGGDINGLFALGNSTVNVYGGAFTILSVNDLPVINMYVQEYTWDPDGGIGNNHGLLTGIWYETGEPFRIDYVDFDAYDRMTFVPEPSMLLLLGIGGIILRHKK